MKEVLDLLLVKLEQLEIEMKPFHEKKNILRQELYKVENTIKKYVVRMFNEDYQEDIRDYEREAISTGDVSVCFKTGVIYAHSDNPRTSHPYDRYSKEYNLTEILKEL